MARHTSGTVDHDLPSTVGWRKLMFSTPSMAVGFRWVGFRQKKQAFWGEILNSEGFLKDQNKQSIFWEVASNTSQTIIPWGKKTDSAISVSLSQQKSAHDPTRIPAKSLCVSWYVWIKGIFICTHHTKQIKTITLLFLEEWPPKRIAFGARLLLFFLLAHHSQPTTARWSRC